MARIASPEPSGVKPEKKSKKEKKRAREDDNAGDGEPKHKKSKSISASATDIAPEVSGKGEKKKKSKKEKHTEDGVTEPEAAPTAEETKSEKKKHKKKKSESGDAAVPEEKKEKKQKKSKKDDSDAPEVESAPEPQETDSDAMDVDTQSQSKPSSSSIHQPPDIPANPQFPFFTQTVSLYEPLFPIGWAQPVTSCQTQHLRHLQNKYVPSLRGVLLDYRNVAFGEKPGRNGAAMDDESPANVISKDEAAVGFGWITADVDLFVPSRGAWMEGSVNLQTEGHIGVVCFGKFNASIEARRLPPSWKWVPNESPEAQGFEETASVITADDHGVVRQIHSTGFWVDGSGEKIKGKIRFRIRNFDVGTAGETSYLSLEGTMLDKKGEKAVVAEEAETARMRKNKKGGQKPLRRRVPDFSMTRFDADEEELQDDEATKREVLAVSED
ncbi:hypothetical protein BGZ63DRAFT_394793 [Mariannaea sp. PMI_226]|nr:hypothetical protein BGZ63DRAFT_394793 [Mariannaea sp. PMI_226]